MPRTQTWHDGKKAGFDANREVWKKERRFHQLNSRADAPSRCSSSRRRRPTRRRRPRSRRSSPATTPTLHHCPGLGRRGSGNACVTRRGGLLIIERRALPRQLCWESALAIARSLQPQSPAADRHDHLVDVPPRERAGPGRGGSTLAGGATQLPISRTHHRRCRLPGPQDGGRRRFFCWRRTITGGGIAPPAKAEKRAPSGDRERAADRR